MSIEPQEVPEAEVVSPLSITEDKFFRSVIEVIAESYDLNVPITGGYSQQGLTNVEFDPKVITITSDNFDAHFFGEIIKAMKAFDETNPGKGYVVGEVQTSAGKFGWRIDITVYPVAE